MHFDLYERRQARPFGLLAGSEEGSLEGEVPRAAEDERARVAAAVRQLFDESPSKS